MAAAAATGAEGGSSKVPSGAGETCISIPSAGGYDKLLVAQGGEVQCDALLALQNHDKQGGVDRSRTVTVQIHAAGVNYADVCIRWGLYASAAEYVGYPITPGVCRMPAQRFPQPQHAPPLTPCCPRQALNLRGQC